MNVAKLSTNKELVKSIGKLNYYTIENFISDAKCYIKAIEQRRMICVIKSVSASGMSRQLKFNSCEKGKDGGFWYRQYINMFLALGYSESKNNNGAFVIGGCGMDMVFHTHYSIIRSLRNMGFITDDKCRTLEQMTPTTL